MTTTSDRRILRGRFRLLENLGKGGMGTVWLAEDTRLERVVALKELIREGDSRDLAVRRERAMQEAKALAKVRHPAIVSIHDVILENGDPWIVMEYISGRSLAAILENGPLDERLIAEYALPVLHALSAAHRAGVVHRDVKPENILVAEDGSVSLVDFGIAQISGARSMTGEDVVMGTTDYLAPERLRSKKASPAADLWSLGVTLFYAREGYLPFSRAGERWQDATMYAIINDDPPRPARDGTLDEVIMRLLEKDPARRPGAAEVAGMLSSALIAPVPPAKAHSQPTSHPSPRRSDGKRSEGRAVAADRKVMEGVGTDAGAAILLAMPPKAAADLLVSYEFPKLGELLQGIAAAGPGAAGAILEVLDVTTAAWAFSHLNPETAASVLEAIPSAEAVRILSRLIPLDESAAAAAIMNLSAHNAVALLKAIPSDRASRALARVWPGFVEAMASVDPVLIERLRNRPGRSARRRA